MNKKKIKIIKKRPVKMYYELNHASSVLIDRSKELPNGAFYEYMASLLFSAFTFEAYLNHLGNKLFKNWDDLENLRWYEKLIVITNHIDLVIDKSRRPFQTIGELFNFRNSISHGKSEFLSKISEIDTDKFDPYKEELPKTKWEKYCTLKNAKRVKKDVEKMITKLHKKAGYDEDTLFHSGMSTMSGTVFNDE